MPLVVYGVLPGGRYVPFEKALAASGAGPDARANVYVNLTNKCNCSCVFCLRGKKKMGPEATLWYGEEGDPPAGKIREALEALPWDRVAEVVFCGFGEPTLRMDDLTALLRWIRQNHPGTPTRLNTNGLAELEFGPGAADRLAGLLDTVSISLNASTPGRYLELTRSRHGIGSWEAMLRFAERCKRFVPHVVLTVVDKVEGGAEIEACRAVCAARGLDLRVRAYEDS